MKFKGKKSILTITTILALSLGIMACARQNTNPPAPGTPNRTGITGTGQDKSGVNLNDGKGTNMMGLNPNGTVVQDNINPDLNPDGTTLRGNNNGNLNTNDRLNTSIGNNRNMIGRNEGFQESTVRDDHPDGNNNSFQRAEKIERAVNSVSGVRGARVVVSNNRALIGIDMPAGTEGGATTTMRNNVERAVKSADPSITTVAVSADPDIFRRITNVGNGIRSGRPFSQFGAEVEEIFNRVIPR